MSLIQASVAPTRGVVVNLLTAEEREFLMNPTEFTESVNVNWGAANVPGLSHAVLQYANTGNTTIPLEFYVDKFFAAQVDPNDSDILEFKKFLQAFTVPPGGAEGVVGGSPPRALVIWPGVISLTCVVRGRIEFRYRQFAQDASLLVYTARVPFEEIRDTRITSDDVRSDGSLRGGF